MLDRRIGAQLYTLRDYCQNIKDFDDTLGKVGKIGYKTIQVSGVGSMPVKEMRKVIDSHGMEVVCTHRSFDDFKKNPDEIIEYNLELGSSIAGIGAMPGECYASFDKIKEFVEDANIIAEKAKKNGLFFGHHNHGFEFVKFDGVYAMDYILNNTDESSYKLILDVYWLAFAALDPAAYIKKIGDRAMAIHFKDMKMTADNKQVMAEVMEGNLDFEAIVKACDEAGSKWALVEQDVCERDPFESMAMSYNNLKKLGFN